MTVTAAGNIVAAGDSSPPWPADRLPYVAMFGSDGVKRWGYAAAATDSESFSLAGSDPFGGWYVAGAHHTSAFVTGVRVLRGSEVENAGSLGGRVASGRRDAWMEPIGIAVRGHVRVRGGRAPRRRRRLRPVRRGRSRTDRDPGEAPGSDLAVVAGLRWWGRSSTHDPTGGGAMRTARTTRVRRDAPSSSPPQHSPRRCSSRARLPPCGCSRSQRRRGAARGADPGEVTWTRYWDSGDDDTFSLVAACPNGDVVAAGRTWSPTFSAHRRRPVRAVRSPPLGQDRGPVHDLERRRLRARRRRRRQLPWSPGCARWAAVLPTSSWSRCAPTAG